MNDFQKEMQTQCWWMIALSAVIMLLSVGFTLSIQSLQFAVALTIFGITPLISVLYQGTHASDSAKWIAVVMLMLYLAFAAYAWDICTATLTGEDR
jgi:hypothetical protein